MFGLQKYIDRLHTIKWQFKDSDKTEFEDIMYVDFRKNGDHYLLDSVHYTYVDILLALEDLDFVMTKNNDDIVVKLS